MNPVISVVVPVYKVENYLEKCILSLLNQTYSDIEIILVDDGSPDDCPRICDDFRIIDARIKVIHKTNGGLSDARNAGLEIAIGKYVLFVDSDDYIESDTCASFIRALNRQEADIIVGNARRIENEQTSYMVHSKIEHIITGEEYLKIELSNHNMNTISWLNMYNRAFLIENNLKFKVGILHEDDHFTPRAFLKAQTVTGIDTIFYNYIIRDGSISKSKDLTKNGIDLINTCYELSSIYCSLADQELKRLLFDHLVTVYLYGFQMGKLFSKEYRTVVKKRFLIGKSRFIKNHCKVLLFVINKRLYFRINNISKNWRLKV